MANQPAISQGATSATLLGVAFVGVSLPIVALLRLLPDVRAFEIAVALVVALVSRFLMPLAEERVRLALIAGKETAPSSSTHNPVSTSPGMVGQTSSRFALSDWIDYTTILNLAKHAVTCIFLLLLGLLNAVLIQDLAKWGWMRSGFREMLSYTGEYFMITVFVLFAMSALRTLWKGAKN